MTDPLQEEDRPHGVIGEEPIFQQELPVEYFKFLKKHDPIKSWEDVVPLETALEAKGIDYPMPWEHINKLTNYAPNLVQTCKQVEWGNEIATVNGLRYAYTRLTQQAHILKLLDRLLQDTASLPTAIVEVGCFTGGLLHFLAESAPSAQAIGFDLSPVALDVASRLSDSQQEGKRPFWLEADFSLVRPEYLPERAAAVMNRPVILLSNVLHAIGQQLSFSPAVDQSHAEAGLISYWVNQGALVVVSERGDDPDSMIQALVNNGRWEGGGCAAEIISEFECWSTREMRPECPLGDWFHTGASVMAFYNSTIWELGEC